MKNKEAYDWLVSIADSGKNVDLSKKNMNDLINICRELNIENELANYVKNMPAYWKHPDTRSKYHSQRRAGLVALICGAIKNGIPNGNEVEEIV